MELFLVSISAFLALGTDALQQGDCIIDLNDKTSFPDPQPIFLRKDLEPRFVEPNKDGVIILTRKDQLQIACPGKGNIFTEIPGNFSELDIYCLPGNKYIIPETRAIVSLKALSCLHLPTSETKVYTGRRCGPDRNDTLIGIGFSTGGYFVALYELCYDETLYSALYSKHTMTPNVKGSQIGLPRPNNFIQDDWFKGLKVSTLYKRKEQIKTFSKILGSESLAKKYVQMTGNNFLSKGHLIAKADMIFRSHQKATFHYINVAPQWQTLNGVNWNNIETDTREYISNMNRTLEIYTGTLGKTSLPDTNNAMKNLFLFHSNKSEDAHKIPVPRYFYKILYDPELGEGIAFLGWNNPHTVPDRSPCKDQCLELPWLSWVQERNNSKFGICFCCDVSEIQDLWSEIPREIKAVKLLV